jgi:hypothetical protein
MKPIASPTRNVAAAIILKAVEDWQALCKGKKAKSDCNFPELRRFFKSEWAEMLASKLGLSAIALLQRLEKERKESEKKENAK